MGRSNIPPIAHSQSELPSTSVPSEHVPNASLNLESAPTLSLDDLTSFVRTDGISSQTTVCSLSPTDDDQPYYDAFDYGEPNGLLAHQLVFNDDSHNFGSALHPMVDGRASGLATIPQGNSQVDSQGILSFPGPVHKALRGVSACIASSVRPSVVSPIAHAASHASPSTSTLRRPSKRAVVVGINYTGPGHEPSRRLRYGVNDARRVAFSLKTRGFPDEGVIVLTDRDSEEESKRATHGTLISWIDWLVRDAKTGDLLVFFFSGHSSSDGTSLVMADGKDFGRDLLHDRLVLPVPVGCDLHIMLDCCSASSIIELQYCIGRMSPKHSFTPTVVFSMPQPALLDTSPTASRPSTQPIAWPSSSIAFAGSLSSTASINNLYPYRAPARPDPWSPAPGGDIGLYRCTTHGGASAVAALPLLNLAETQTPSRSTPLIFSGVGQALPSSPVAPSHAATTQGSTRGRQAPIQGGHVRDHFSERPGRFVKPAGTVMLWASTGTHRSTFEAYNGQDVRNGAKIRNGIVPNTICTALNGCAGSGLFVRDLWKQIVEDIEQENDWRRERDAAKPWNSRPNPFFREQCAELWVSHPTSLSTAGPVLDRPVFGD